MKRLATLAVSALVAVGLTAAPAQAEPGTRSLAEVLTADGNHYDTNPHDFDILTEAVLAVAKAKPSSPVTVLTQGDVALTAFLPKDRAFKRLLKSVTGQNVYSEKQVFNKIVAAYGLDGVEQVLLYHVIPGQTITAAQALQADGAKLTTAQGNTVTVDVRRQSPPSVRLIDRDYSRGAWDPFIKRFDINKGNAQIGHAIDRVLRPFEL